MKGLLALGASSLTYMGFKALAGSGGAALGYASPFILIYILMAIGGKK